MGFGVYTLTRNGEEIYAGYEVKTICEDRYCTAQIDRGLAYLCGEAPGGDEYGCGGYFCGHHLYGAPEGQRGGRCPRCKPAD